VYVTHDQVEAMTLGQRVAVMRDGRVQQVDVPQTLYAAPRNLYVAAFIGSPSMNFVHATLDDASVEFAGFRLPLAARRPPAEQVVLGIRPEAFEDAAFADPSLPQIEVQVDVLEEVGADSYVVFRVDAPRIETEDVRAVVDEQEEAALLADEPTSLFTARVDPETKARPGTSVRLAVDTRRFHFFDPDNGDSLTA
jgi:multiple sugar transport system ATP-binding protein